MNTHLYIPSPDIGEDACQHRPHGGMICGYPLHDSLHDTTPKPVMEVHEFDPSPNGLCLRWRSPTRTSRWNVPIRQPEHPAKYSAPIGVRITDYLNTCHLPFEGQTTGLVWDPFGGTGRIHDIVANTNKPLKAVSTEIELEWAWQGVDELADDVSGRSVCADMLRAPFRPDSFVAVATSPCYGNRMADHHENKDPCSRCGGTGKDPVRMIPPAMQRASMKDTHDACSKCKGDGRSVRNTYRHKLGRALTPGSAAMLQWGPAYRAFHEDAWGEVWLHLKPRGLFILNVSDHIRAGAREFVSQWHHETILSLPFSHVDTEYVETKRNKQGDNGKLRVDHECIFVYRKK